MKKWDKLIKKKCWWKIEADSLKKNVDEKVRQTNSANVADMIINLESQIQYE